MSDYTDRQIALILIALTNLEALLKAEQAERAALVAYLRDYMGLDPDDFAAVRVQALADRQRVSEELAAVAAAHVDALLDPDTKDRPPS